MIISEQLFYTDSKAIAEFLDLITGEEGEQYRWLFALRNVDMLLDDFGYNLSSKSSFLESLFNGFHHEINNGSKDKQLMVSLNEKYRNNKHLIIKILDRSQDDEEIEEAVACFDRRSIANKPLIAEIKACFDEQNFDAVVADLLRSYIHMTMNRMFLVKQRIHETVIYHHLTKYYTSAIMRSRQSEKNTKTKPVSD